MAEPTGTIWDAGRRLYPAERLWLAVLDQACADSGARNDAIRTEAAEWWDSDMPALFSRVLDIPASKLARLRAARGGLRMTADTGCMGRRLGVRVADPTDYHYARRAPTRRTA